MRAVERLVRIARRIGSWRAPLVFGVFGLSLPAYALILSDARAATHLIAASLSPDVFRIVVAALAACAACMIVVKEEPSFRSLLVLYTCGTSFLMIAYGLRLETNLLLVLSNVLWAVLFEPFPTCLVLGGGAALLFPALLLLGGGRGVLASSAVGIAGMAEALLGSLLVRAREKMIELQRYADRLEGNVASLTRANILSQDYARDVEVESRARERDRLTRDIHDSIGYTLTNTVMMVEAIKVMVRAEPDRVPHQVRRIRAQVEEGHVHIRQILREFRARERETEPVYWAVKKLVKVFTLSTGMKVSYETGNADIGDLERFPDAVYHFVQEGLINAFRHGHASRVKIMFWDYGDCLRIVLDDDGLGCPNGVTPGIGIAGMKERATLAGGKVTIDSMETGFRISMYLPTGNGHGDQNQTPDC